MLAVSIAWSKSHATILSVCVECVNLGLHDLHDLKTLLSSELV